MTHGSDWYLYGNYVNAPLSHTKLLLPDSCQMPLTVSTWASQKKEEKNFANALDFCLFETQSSSTSTLGIKKANKRFMPALLSQIVGVGSIEQHSTAVICCFT